MSLKHPRQTKYIEGRVDRPDLVPIDGIFYVFVSRHSPDNGTKVPHMHMVIKTALSHKKLRKAVRAAYQLESTMDLMFREFDESKVRSLVKYYIDHDDAAILACEEQPFIGLVPELRNELAARHVEYVPTVTQADIDRQIAEQEAVKQHFRETWDVDPPDLDYTKQYRHVIDHIEYMTKHWSQYREWSFMDYAKHVMEYLTWPDHDIPMYRMVYSEFRFRGDIKLLYGRYWGITPSLLRRIFGHDP